MISPSDVFERVRGALVDRYPVVLNPFRGAFALWIGAGAAVELLDATMLAGGLFATGVLVATIGQRATERDDRLLDGEPRSLTLSEGVVTQSIPPDEHGSYAFSVPFARAAEGRTVAVVSERRERSPERVARWVTLGVLDFRGRIEVATVLFDEPVEEGDLVSVHDAPEVTITRGLDAFDGERATGAGGVEA